MRRIIKANKNNDVQQAMYNAGMVIYAMENMLQNSIFDNPQQHYNFLTDYEVQEFISKCSTSCKEVLLLCQQLNDELTQYLAVRYDEPEEIMGPMGDI